MDFLTHEDEYGDTLTLTHRPAPEEGAQPLVHLVAECPSIDPEDPAEFFLCRDDVMIVIEALAGWMEETEDPDA